jgi:hypothetical protein
MNKLKKTIDKNTKLCLQPALYKELNVHKWATKIEAQHLIGGKPELELKKGK